MPDLVSDIRFTDTGARPAAENMTIDSDALFRAGAATPSLTVRFFRWDRASVTYGYLLDPARVAQWATGQGIGEVVKRPTGGGAVLHRPTDLSLSLLWPRHTGPLPDQPSEAYAQIHNALGRGLQRFQGSADDISLKKKANCGRSAAPSERFSACYQEPVCDDVMVKGQKVIGGALRITRHAVLYQGNVSLAGADLERLQGALKIALREFLF